MGASGRSSLLSNVIFPSIAARGRGRHAERQNGHSSQVWTISGSRHLPSREGGRPDWSSDEPHMQCPSLRCDAHDPGRRASLTSPRRSLDLTAWLARSSGLSPPVCRRTALGRRTAWHQIQQPSPSPRVRPSLAARRTDGKGAQHWKIRLGKTWNLADLPPDSPTPTTSGG